MHAVTSSAGRRTTEPVPVLLYHSVAGETAGSDPFAVRLDDFRRDMAAVAESGRTAMTATGYHGWCQSVGRGDVRPVLVTFDDGFADYADRALPVLQEHDLASTLFVTTGWLGRREMLSRSALAALGSLPGRSGGPVVEIGAHSVSHSHLDTLRPGEARRELCYARETLEDALGAWVTAMAYPHGSHSALTKRLARETGHITAHAVKNALSHPDDDPFAVGRFTVHAGTTRAQVRAALSGGGAPRSWTRERLRTRAFRAVRRTRGGLAVDPTPP